VNLSESEYTPVDKIIALWAFTEAFLAGTLHLMKMPFTGLIISNLAILYISLISFFSEQKGTIFKATIIVIILKFVLSPYSPAMSFFAVFYQGLIGEIVYFSHKYKSYLCYILAILIAILTSAQKIITTTIIFGMTIWDSLDKFVIYISDELFLSGNNFIISNFSFYLISSYFLLHIITGMIAAVFITRFLKKLSALQSQDEYILELDLHKTEEMKIVKNKKRKIKPYTIILSVFVIFIIFLTYYSPGKLGINPDSVFLMLTRAVLIILIWYYFISPLLTKILQKHLERKSRKYSDKISMVIKLEPLIRNLVPVAWKKASEKKGIKRISYFIKLSVINFLVYSP